MATKKKTGKQSGSDKKKDKSVRTLRTTKENVRTLEQQEQFNILKAEIMSIILFMLSVFIYICVSRLDGLAANEQFIGLVGSGIMKGLKLLLGDGAFSCYYGLYILGF